MMLDILHQLLKEAIGDIHMLQWLKTIIRAKFKGACIKTGITKSLQQTNKMVLLNQRFCAMPFYPTFKIFKEYNEVK